MQASAAASSQQKELGYVNWDSSLESNNVNTYDEPTNYEMFFGRSGLDKMKTYAIVVGSPSYNI